MYVFFVACWLSNDIREAVAIPARLSACPPVSLSVYLSVCRSCSLYCYMGTEAGTYVLAVRAICLKGFIACFFGRLPASVMQLLIIANLRTRLAQLTERLSRRVIKFFKIISPGNAGNGPTGMPAMSLMHSLWHINAPKCRPTGIRWGFAGVLSADHCITRFMGPMPPIRMAWHGTVRYGMVRHGCNCCLNRSVCAKLTGNVIVICSYGLLKSMLNI